MVFFSVRQKIDIVLEVSNESCLSGKSFSLNNSFIFFREFSFHYLNANGHINLNERKEKKKLSYNEEILHVRNLI